MRSPLSPWKKILWTVLFYDHGCNCVEQRFTTFYVPSSATYSCVHFALKVCATLQSNICKFKLQSGNVAYIIIIFYLHTIYNTEHVLYISLQSFHSYKATRLLDCSNLTSSTSIPFRNLGPTQKSLHDTLKRSVILF